MEEDFQTFIDAVPQAKLAVCGGIKMKKIAILLSTIPQSGGEHQYLKLLVESLVLYDKSCFEVTAICCNSFWSRWCRERHISRVQYKMESYSMQAMRFNAFFPILPFIYNRYKSELEQIVRKNKINILIIGQQGVFVPKLSCKVIQPVHDLMHRYEPQFMEIRDSYKEREETFSCGARCVDVVLADSKLGMRQYKECYCQKKQHRPRIRILPFVAQSYEGIKEESMDVPQKYIFYPAQFWEHKNHKNLILAIAMLKKKLPEIHLILVGSERNSLHKTVQLIRDNGLEDNVSIMGFVTDGQIVFLYRHATALVMPTYFGPTNIPPLEAMALGCPVIVSKKYAMGEQVGEAGMLCDPDLPESIAECIEKVWCDEGLRKDMITKGYQQSRKWTIQDFKKRFIKILNEEL